MSSMCDLSRSLLHMTPNVQRFMDSNQHCRFHGKETLKSMFFASLKILQFKYFDNDNPACSSHCRSAVSSTAPIATANINVWGWSYLEPGVTAYVDAWRWFYVESLSPSRGCSTLFDIETVCLSILLQIWHKTFCNFRILIQMPIQYLTLIGIQFYNFLLSVFGHGVIFGVTSEHSTPFCGPPCLPPLRRKIYSDAICSIWYTCRTCAARRSHVLQQKNILQLAWTFLPIYCNKTKKFNIHIFRQAFQPNIWSNIGRITVTTYFNFFSVSSFVA